MNLFRVVVSDLVYSLGNLLSCSLVFFIYFSDQAASGKPVKPKKVLLFNFKGEIDFCLAAGNLYFCSNNWCETALLSSQTTQLSLPTTWLSLLTTQMNLPIIWLNLLPT